MVMSETDKKVLTLGLIFALALAIIAYYLYHQLAVPSMVSNAKQREEFDKKIKAFEGEKREIDKAISERNNIKKLRDLLVKRASRLPSDPDWEGNLQQFNRLVAETGISTSGVSPQPHKAQTLYTEFPFDIAGNARYHEFGLFLNLVELNQTRLMRVKSFELDNDKKNPVIHPIKLTLASYMFNQKLPDIPTKERAKKSSAIPQTMQSKPEITPAAGSAGAAVETKKDVQDRTGRKSRELPTDEK